MPTAALHPTLARANGALERGRGADASPHLIPLLRSGSLNREDELTVRAALAEAWLLQDDLPQATTALGRPPDTLQERISDARRMLKAGRTINPRSKRLQELAEELN